MIVKRHIVDIYRPAEGLDSRGQRDTAADTLLGRKVPCSIEPLSGRELEIARQNFPTASHRVRLFVNSSWALVPRDYLQWGSQKLEIGFVNYHQGITWEAELTVGQWVSG